MDAAATGPPVPTGRLEARPVPRLLVELAAAGATGTLVLEGPGRERARVAWLRGMPVDCACEPAAPGLIDFLRERGAIDAATAGRARAARETQSISEEAALLSLRAVAPRDLVLARKDLLARRLVSLARLEAGAFRFEGDTSAPAGSEPLRIDPLPVVQRMLATEWRPDRLLGDLEGRLRAYPRPGTDFERAAARLERGAGVDALLGALDGSQTAWALLGATGDRSRIAALWVLDACGALAWSETPAAAAGDAAGESGDASAAAAGGATPASDEPLIEIEVAHRPARTADVEAAASRAARAAKDDALAAALEAEIAERRSRLDELDHYALLGVARGAAAADVKRAYLKAAKRFHPDALSRLGLEALKRDANELFAAITRAHEVLSDPARRRDYDASLDGHVQIDADRVAQAEVLYRKADLLMRAGQFQQALELAQGAVALWAEDAAYQGAYGWCLFKKNPPDPARALEHLQRAVALDPRDAVAHLRLGIVLREAGDAAGATRATANARALDPKARA
ncbi:MAG TPA: DnaJ domain-containing protein [Myxococcota bacterium]|nr:DnaJ domain-containing protein [Myxococcota bacterium]